MKNVLYILIFTTLIGVFVPFLKIQAQTYAPCYIVDERETSGYRRLPSTVTKVYCDSQGGIWNPSSPPQKTIVVKGTCVYGSGQQQQTVSNVTKPNCENSLSAGGLGGVWTAGPPTQQDETTYSENTSLPYKLLSPFPSEGGFLEEVDVAGENALGKYLNVIIRLLIGIAAVLAMVMIVMGGIQYMTSELAHSKEAGKSKITNAILGLLIALGAWLILFTINPDLLDTDVKIETTIIEYEGSPESTASFSPATATSLQALGIKCDSSLSLKDIAESFVGKSTYSMDKRGTVADNTAYFDCSSYVAQVYACRGISRTGLNGNTTTIFNGAEQIQNVDLNSPQPSINGVSLQIGDLIGWTKASAGTNFGHVLMYIGDGKVIDSRFRTPFNQGVNVSSLSSWIQNPKVVFVRRINLPPSGEAPDGALY